MWPSAILHEVQSPRASLELLPIWNEMWYQNLIPILGGIQSTAIFLSFILLRPTATKEYERGTASIGIGSPEAYTKSS
jgi:hypothetical protein